MAVGTLFNIYVFLTMKAFYKEPRPYWTSKQIQNIGYYCPKDYGSPSGHTEFAVFIFMLFIIHFNKNKNMWPIFLNFFTILCVMISRMFLGGHSLDQVIFGFIVAGCVIIIYDVGGGKNKIAELFLNFEKSYAKKTLFATIFICHLIALGVYVNNYFSEEEY